MPRCSGAFVAREALRPVRRLTDTAEHVAETHDLTQPHRRSGHDELSRLATSFNTMLAALEQAVAAQRQLVADASHELRTPLTSLRTNFEVLMRPAPLPEESRRKLEQDVHRQFEELRRWSATSSSSRATASRPARRTTSASTSWSPRPSSGPSATPTPSASSSTPGRRSCAACPARLDRAVRNLLDNAAKWSPPGEVVEVEVGEGTVSVRDHGPGIADADLPFIFDRFYRAAEARSCRARGWDSRSSARWPRRTAAT